MIMHALLGMVVNAIKTKVMVFGGQSHGLTIKIQNAVIEQVNSFKYLGVILDPMLDFGLQVDYTVGKAKRALNKISTLIKGRQGISVKLGTDLFKSLIRPHLEYAIPVWANISDKDMEKLERTPVQCLRRIVGAKSHSSSSAVEVVCGVIPFRYCRREIRCREYIRIQAKNNGHDLIKLMESSTRLWLRFCPLEYIKTLSRELHRAVDGQRLLSAFSHKLQDTQLTNISIINILGNGSLTNSVHHIPGHTSDSKMKEMIDDFICQKRKHLVMIQIDQSMVAQLKWSLLSYLVSSYSQWKSQSPTRAVGRMDE